MNDSGLTLDLRATLGMPTLHEELRRMVQRRVPSENVDDLVQSVLCDALAAPHQPIDAAEVPRWVMAIARNKVADFHRCAWREQASEAVEATASLPEPVEARELLRAVLDESRRQPRTLEVLGWIVREWSGERLCDIAVEAALPAEVVRQRIARLRRQMRVRWLPVTAALVFAIGIPGARDAASSVARTVGGWVEQLTGRTAPPFRVLQIEPPSTLDAGRASWVRAEAALAAVRWEGESVVIETPSRRWEGRAQLSRGEDGELAGQLVLSDGRSFPLRVREDGGRVTVEMTGGAAGGRVVLSAGQGAAAPAARGASGGPPAARR